MHDEVVLGDHRLRREGHHLLPQVDSAAYPVHAGHEGVESGRQRPVVGTEPLHDVGAGLRHDPYRSTERHQHHGCGDPDDD